MNQQEKNFFLTCIENCVKDLLVSTPHTNVLQINTTLIYYDFFFQIGKECLSCRNDAALFNMSYFGKLLLTGRDAEKAADWIFTNNMNQPGSGNVTMATDSC